MWSGVTSTSAMLTLAKSDPETQFIVCRNAQMLLNVFPDLLSENFDSFFIRFSDPAYVKLEKLRLLLRLVNSSSAAGVIKEFAEYANEVDPVFIATHYGKTHGDHSDATSRGKEVEISFNPTRYWTVKSTIS